jgi:hypothetical protein
VLGNDEGGVPEPSDCCPH